jgi:ribose 5-phosphate isomerase RpiB
MARLAIAADHNGVALKASAVEDLGAHGPELVDYPALCVAVGGRVAGGAVDIVVGGSGQGTRSASPASPSTPTSGGWPAASAEPTRPTR